MGLEDDARRLNERLATISTDLAAKTQEALQANDEVSTVRLNALNTTGSLKKLQAVEKVLNDHNTTLCSQLEGAQQRLEEQDREIAELMTAASASGDRADGESLADEMSRKHT